MSTSHARIVLFGSGPALDAAADVLRLAGRNPLHADKSEELSTADEEECESLARNSGLRGW